MDMKHVKYLALVLCIGNLSPVMAQTASKSLTVDNLVAWQRISGQAISDNGKWVACKMEPWEGDAVVNLYDAQGKELATFPRADRFLFSASSDYLVVSQKPGKMIVDSLKIKKTKKGDKNGRHSPAGRRSGCLAVREDGLEHLPAVVSVLLLVRDAPQDEERL